MKFLFSTTLILVFSFTGYSQSDSATIPVRLSYFEAGPNAGNTILRWKTVCYLDYANFNIQKSTDGSNYQSINNFTADKLRCQQPFDFTDNNSGLAARVFYRITVKDIDGKAYQSKIVSVFNQGKGFAINSFAPTIISTAVNISISSSANEIIQLSLINIQGAIVKQQSIAVTKGASTHQVSMEELQKGKYLAIFQTQEGERDIPLLRYKLTRINFQQ
jgi:hypothetical protein